MATFVSYAGALAVNRSLRDVEGASMSPTLEHRDRILVLPVPPQRLRSGDVITVRDPRDPTRVTVKRLYGRSGAGLVVLGDNPAASTDSRTFGAVPEDLYAGRVAWRVRPWGPIAPRPVAP